MAQIRKTTYICDSCGTEVAKKSDLRTIQLVPKTNSGYDYQRAVRPELCESCEGELLEQLVKFVREDDKPTVESYRRKES